MGETRKRAVGPGVQLNLNVRGLPVSATIEINERTRQMKRDGKTVFRLGLGQSPFPVPAPVVEALREHAHQKDYLPVRGLQELREAVVEHHCHEFGIQATPEDVLVGPGSKELMFILQLVYYGDLVVPTPTWVSYAPQAQIIGRQVRVLHTKSEDGWCLSGKVLDEFCRTDRGRPRIVILNYPSNPTGVTYSTDELAELAEVARKHRVVLLSDEIYGQIHHEGEHASIGPLYPDGTIFSGGLSKWCGAGGWRLGIFVFPERLHWLLEAMSVVASETFTSTSAPIQYAAVRAFQGGPEIESYLSASRTVLKALGNHVADRLTEVGVKVRKPQGGFYLFPDFELLRGKFSCSRDLCEQLLRDTGVALLPGEAFGRVPEELTARLAYVDFDGGAALEAVEKGAFDLKGNCAPVMEATDRICNWAADQIKGVTPPAP